MPSVVLTNDLLRPPEARQQLVSRSQKEAWLRQMENERRSQFASVAGNPDDARAMEQSLGGGGRMPGAVERPPEVSGLRHVSTHGQSLLAPVVPRHAAVPTGLTGYGQYPDQSILPQSPPLVQRVVLASDESSLAPAAGQGVAWPSLEHAIRRLWPRVNLFLTKDKDDVRIWVRDVELLSQREAIATVVNHIKSQVAGDGLRLKSLTINGETIFCDERG